MKQSKDRFLITHVGSLPRSRELSDLLIRRESKEEYNEEEYRELSRAGVQTVIKAQVDSGIDVINCLLYTSDAADE